MNRLIFVVNLMMTHGMESRLEDEEGSVHTTLGPLYNCIFSSQPQPPMAPLSDSHPDTERSLVLHTSKLGYYESMLSKFKDNLMSSKLQKDEVLWDDNWMAWKARIMQTLWMHWIDGFLLGKYLPPDQDLEPAEYDGWEIIDQAIIQYVKANINNDQLISIPEFLEINIPTSMTQTSSETWNTLLQVYKSHTSQTANNLFWALAETHTNDSTNIIKHLTNIQNVHTKLVNLGYPMEDYRFNGFLTSSLLRSWDTYTTGLQGIQASTGKEGKPALPTLLL